MPGASSDPDPAVRLAAAVITLAVWDLRAPCEADRQTARDFFDGTGDGDALDFWCDVAHLNPRTVRRLAADYQNEEQHGTRPRDTRRRNTKLL